MAYTNRKNRDQQPFLPSASAITLSIPPNQSILRGMVILTGTVTIAGGTTNGIVVGEGGPLNLIHRIRIAANPAAGSAYPGGYLVDCTPRTLLRWAQLQHFGKYIGEQSGSTLGNGAPGVYPIYLAIPIYFADDNLRNQVQTALTASETAYESLQVQVATGQLSDCFAGSDRTATYNLQVQWWDDRAAIQLGNSDIVLFQEDHQLQIGAANTRLNDPAMPQSGAFMSWTILAEQGSSKTLSDALLNKLYADSATWSYEEFAQDLRQTMYDEEWLDPSQNGAGLYHVDMTKGVLWNSNPARGIDLRLDVNNPSGAFADALRFFTRRAYTVALGS